MTRPPSLAAAFEAASGRSAEAGADASLLAWARRVLAARQRGLEAEPCPAATLARVRGLLAAPRPASVLGRLRLVFDSWQAPAAAMRGVRSTHHLTFEAGGLTVDVEARPLADGGLAVSVACEGPRPARVRVGLEGGRPRTVALDEDGLGSVRWKEARGAAHLEVETSTGEVLRTPPWTWT